MKKKPTVVEFQQPQGSLALDVLVQMLSNTATRKLLEEPGTRVVRSVDPTTHRTVVSFRAADYSDDAEANE